MSNVRLVSCWSKAGVGTSVVLEYSSSSSQKKRPRIVLDLGATPTTYGESIRANTVLISHGHLDHVGAIFSHARAHSVSCGGSVPTYVVPEVIRQKVEDARNAMAALDGHDRSLLSMNIVGVEPGSEIELPIRGLFCRAFAVTHASCPAVGYVLLSKSTPVLKDEYHGLDKKDIRELIRNGVAVKTDPQDVLLAAYTGDTSVDGLSLKNDVPFASGNERQSALYMEQAFHCGMLFCEASFLDNSEKAKDLAVKRGHLHIEDIARLLAEHKFGRRHQQLVLLHISARYSAQGAMDHIVKALPSNIATRCFVAISSLLEPAHSREKGWSRLVRGNGCILLSDYIRTRKQAKGSH